MDELTRGLSIGEVAHQAGVRTSALRYYESIGMLPPPKRINGRRKYDPSVLQRLDVIALGKRAGFTMTEIDALLHGFDPDTIPSDRWRILAQQKLHEIELLIRHAQNMKRLLEEGLNCGCLQFDDCVIIANEGCVSK